MLYKALMQEQESGSLYTQKKFTWQEIPIPLLAPPNKLPNSAKSANMATSFAVPAFPEHHH
jgi:hypothetical protein